MNNLLAQYKMKGQILPIKSVGVQGDFRTYHHPAIVWFENNKDLNWNVLKEVSTKIINNMKTVNRLIFSFSKVARLSLEELYLEKNNLDQLRLVDEVLRAKTDFIKEIWQMPVVQLPLLDEDKKLCYVMRPVSSQDAMSADFYEMNFDYLDKVICTTQDITSAGRIFYDITTKPPGTIEWE